MTEIRKGRNFTVAGILVAALSIFALAGCFAAAGNYMNWQAVDANRAMTADIASQKWKTYRFETVGSFPEQRLGYVMFGDNLTVDMWKIPYVNLGTLSLQDVRNNYDATLKERMWTGTTLVFREYRRGEKIVAYVASEFQMDVDLWEMAASGDKVDAKLVYIDRRSFSDTGGGGSDSSTH